MNYLDSIRQRILSWIKNEEDRRRLDAIVVCVVDSISYSFNTVREI